MASVKVFQMLVKLQGQGHKVNDYVTNYQVWSYHKEYIYEI